MPDKEHKGKFVGLDSLFEKDRPLSPYEMSDPRLTGKLRKITMWPVQGDSVVDRIIRKLASYVRRPLVRGRLEKLIFDNYFT